MEKKEDKEDAVALNQELWRQLAALRQQIAKALPDSVVDQPGEAKEEVEVEVEVEVDDDEGEQRIQKAEDEEERKRVQDIDRLIQKLNLHRDTARSAHMRADKHKAAADDLRQRLAKEEAEERKVRSFAVLHDEASAKTEQEVTAARQSLIEWSEERKRKAEERRKQREEERKREAERKRQEERAALLVELNALYQQITGSDEHTLTALWPTYHGVVIEAEIARSGQATVYRAHYRGKLVAVKVFNVAQPSPIANEAESRIEEHFLNELESLMTLQHENIIKIKMCFHRPKPCIVMHYYKQGTLTGYLQTHGGLSAGEIKRMGLGIARGLAYLHEHNVIHRDLKSPNILLSDTLEPLIADFGLSRFSTSTHTMATGITGTWHWMAPELLEGEGASYDNKVDIYAVGVILWEMLSGQMPYSGMSISQIIKNVESGGRLPVAKHWPASLVNVMKACWHHHASQRPSADELVRKLEAVPEEGAPFAESVIVNKAQAAQLEKWYGTRWQLLYRASQDGWSAADFHRCCDDKGSTVTIIRIADNGSIFGGYLEASWCSPKPEDAWIRSPASLFTLVNVHNIEPASFPARHSNYAAKGSTKSGPYFGDQDLVIFGNANSHAHSRSQFPSSVWTGGRPGQRANHLLAGTECFRVAEIEVFHRQP